MGRLSDLIRRPGPVSHGTPIDAPFTPELAVAAPPPPPEVPAADDGSIPFVEIGGPGPAMFGFASSPDWPAVTVPKIAAIEPLHLEFRASEPAAPSGSLAEELIAFYSPDHRVSRQYLALFHDIASRLPGSAAKTVLLTSSESGSGATTVLLNLAVTAAVHGGGTVLVIDANRERPAVAERMGVRPAPGWSEALAGRTAAAWAIRPTAQERLFALTAGRATLAGVETSAHAILDECRRQYNWIFIDGPAGAVSPELLTLADASVAVYLIERQGRDGDDAAARFRDQLRDGSDKLRGVILTHHAAG